jgi:hypothetical protein
VDIGCFDHLAGLTPLPLVHHRHRCCCVSPLPHPLADASDPSGELYRALGFSPGFAPDVKISAYAKLLPMLAGIGSPGTIQEVLRGYTGDRSAKPVFVATRGGTTDGMGSGVSGTVDGTVGGGGVAGGAAEGGGSLFDVLGKDYQRPFELATLRLFNMGLVLSHCESTAVCIRVQ